MERGNGKREENSGVAWFYARAAQPSLTLFFSLRLACTTHNTACVPYHNLHTAHAWLTSLARTGKNKALGREQVLERALE